MAESTQHRAWPLYVVPDVMTGDQIPLGRIVHNGDWRIEHEDLSLVEDLPHGAQLRTLAAGWLEELSREVRAANGSDDEAEPLSVSRMEWRRVFHNNHLRIGPAEVVAVPHAA